MSDQHSFDPEDDGDDPLARIRARFEEASERILSGSDDADLPLPPPVSPGEAPPPSSVSTLPTVDDSTLDDFGQIDIQDDARFSLDFEHGVSTPLDPDAPPPPPIPINRLLGDVDLAANLLTVRGPAPVRLPPTIDRARHDKHRTRGPVEHVPGAETVEIAQDTAVAVVPPVEADPKPEKPEKLKKEKPEKLKKEKLKKEKSEKRRDVPARPAAASSGDEEAPPSQRGRKIALAVAAFVLVAAGGAAAFFLLSPSDGSSTPATTAAASTTTTRLPATPSEAAANALDAFGFSTVQVGVDETGLATIVGTVRTAKERDIAVDAVMGADGVVGVVTDLTYDISRSADLVTADIDTVVAGIDHEITMTWSGGIAVVSGIVPEDAVTSGELGADGTLENELLGIDGVEEVRFELTLRGNPTRLSNRITQLLTTSPIIYDEETGERSVDSDGTLDEIISLLADEPGLAIRVAVVGDDDEDTIPIAEARRDEIIAYLVDGGVDAPLVQNVLVATMSDATRSLPGDVLVEVVTP